MRSQRLKSQSTFLQNNSEFHLEEDDFLEARNKGVRSWIISHIFYKSNKYLMALFFAIIVLTSFFGSYIYIIIGKAIEVFSKGQSDQVVSYTFIVLFIGLGSPILGLL